MTRALCLILFCIILSSCGGNPVTKPAVLNSAESYSNDGILAFEDADWYRAQWFFNQALLLYQGKDDQPGVLYSHINLAEVALSERDNLTVQRHLDNAAEIAKKDSLQHYQPRITLLYALNALQQQQTDLADFFLKRILPEFDGELPIAIPDAIQIAAIANRTKIAFILKQREALWTQRYARALKLSTLKNPSLEARLLRFQSSLLQDQGLYQEAESSLQKALSGYKKDIGRAGIAETLSELGQLYISQGRWQDAQDYLKRSIAVFRYLKDSSKVNQVTESLIKVKSKLGN